jgi:hypothetical protein
VKPVVEASYPPCPTPEKTSWLKKSEALLAADNARKHGRFAAEPYWCPCMRYHLTDVDKHERKLRERRERFNQQFADHSRS